MHIYESSKLMRFNTGNQIFEAVVFQNKSVHWMSLPARDIDGNPLDGNNRDVYRSLRSTYPDLSFCSAEQIHSNNIETVKIKSEFNQMPNCDGLITSLSNIALIIRTADCMPIFIFDENHIAILHAGHRGIYENIIQRWYSMRGSMDSQLVLGDHIKHCCFKVHEDLYSRFKDLPYLAPNTIRSVNSDQWSISLVATVLSQWIQLGLNREQFFDFSTCTCCNAFTHSYRRSGGKLHERLGHLIFKI